MSPMKAAAAYVGAPYVVHGETPGGWDCQGCAAYLRREIFDKDTPSFAQSYRPLDVLDREYVAARMRDELAMWREVPPGPGAIVLFKLFGRPCHVGLMLTRTDFIHALEGCETAIESVTDHRWKGRVVAYYDRD